MPVPPSLAADALTSPPAADNMLSKPGAPPESSPNGRLPNEQHISVSTADFTPNKERADSFRTPLSPASATQHLSHDAKQERTKARRLFSLNSLRSSFSSSRSSLPTSRIYTRSCNSHAIILIRDRKLWSHRLVFICIATLRGHAHYTRRVLPRNWGLI